MKPLIDREKLVELMTTASARQGETVRATVRDMTLKALQGRELTLQNIRKVLQQVTDATSAGAGARPAGAADVSGLLAKAVDGMDDALLKAVEANRVALERFVEQGVDLQKSQMKKALDDLDRMEDALIAAVRRHTASDPLSAAWEPILQQMKLQGTGTGAQVAATIEQFGGQMRDAVRESRAMGLKAANALAESYAAIVGGVLLGMSEAMRSATDAGAGRGRGRKGS